MIKILRENKEKELDCNLICKLSGLSKSSINRQMGKLELYGYKIKIRIVKQKGHEKRVFCFLGDKDDE